MAASDKDSDLLLALSEQVKEIVKELSECDNVKESNNNNKSKEKINLYELFYGSDAEESDEDDWPHIDDETREKMQLERGPPSYNRKAFEEARKIRVFKYSVDYEILLESRDLPKPPPPPPSPSPSPPPPSRDFLEHLRFLDQHVKKFLSLRRHPGLESPC